MAWVVVEPDATATADELTDHVANLLTKHKRPREVHFVDALPRNAMGKVVKREPCSGRNPWIAIVSSQTSGGASQNPKEDAPRKPETQSPSQLTRTVPRRENSVEACSRSYRPARVRSISGLDPILLPPPGTDTGSGSREMIMKSRSLLAQSPVREPAADRGHVPCGLGRARRARRERLPRARDGRARPGAGRHPARQLAASPPPVHPARPADLLDGAGRPRHSRPPTTRVRPDRQRGGRPPRGRDQPDAGAARGRAPRRRPRRDPGPGARAPADRAGPPRRGQPGADRGLRCGFRPRSSTHRPRSSAS